MALDFKQTSKRSHGKKGQPRHTKEYKEYDGRHMPTRKLLGSKYIGDWYNYPRVNMKAWLTRQLDRPINDVFSDFVKEFKKTYRGSQSPDEFFYCYVDRMKESGSRYWTTFYVSDSGFLCRYSKYHRPSWKIYNKRRQEVKAHVEYNKQILKKLEVKGEGPKYLGKVWVTGKGVTKIVNVWLIFQAKLEGHTSSLKVADLSKSMKNYLQDFTPVSVAGYGDSWTTQAPVFSTISDFLYNVTYKFIAKLSDLK